MGVEEKGFFARSPWGQGRGWAGDQPESRVFSGPAGCKTLGRGEIVRLKRNAAEILEEKEAIRQKRASREKMWASERVRSEL